MTPYISNWFMLLLLCISAPLVLCCDQFSCGSRQVQCEPVDLYTIFGLPGSSGWQNSPTRTTQLKTRLDAAVAMRVYSISAGRTLHLSRNTPYIFTILYLILIHLWNKSTYIIHLLLQVWNEIIADDEQKLGKLGESKFIHMTVNGGGL